MPEPKDLKTILEDAIRKRDELNIFIKMLQEAGVEPTLTAANGNQPVKSSQDIGDPLTVVFPGMFFGKTQPQAVKALLEKMHRPIKTKLLVDCLKKGGLEMQGKRPQINLWGALNRNPDTFILVPRAGWGLVDWYDASVIAKYRKEGQKENGEEEEQEKE